MKYLRQGDPEWGSITIGETNYRLSRWGCTITCISMLSSYYGCYKDPANLAGKLKFTNDARIYWTSIKPALCFEFIWRFYGADYQRIDEALLGSDETSVILEVDHSHWVVAIGKVSEGVYKIADPIDGKVKTTKSYGSITGGATFKGKIEEKEQPSDFAKVAWRKAVDKGLLKDERPQDPVTREELAIVLERLNQ